MLQALESNGLVRTLAEPTLTAVSGETASFLVGGKFPLPTVVGIGSSAQIVPQFYPFGVQLTFTPVVLSSGLISLKIATSVSATGTPTSVGGTSVPSLTERSATTTVELPSGGGVAIAGLLQSDIQNTIQGLPGLMDLPILGALFSSKQFQHDETELVIAVSAYLVRPVDPNALSFPADGFGPASDFNMYFLGRLNADAPAAGKPKPAAAEGTLRLHPGVTAMSLARSGLACLAVLGAILILAACGEPIQQDYTKRFPIGAQPETVTLTGATAAARPVRRRRCRESFERWSPAISTAVTGC